MPNAEVTELARPIDGPALITGGASGIGLAIAKSFAARGAAVAILDRDLTAAETAAREIEAGGGAALPLHADVGEPDAVEAAVAACIAQFGGLRHAVANAGVASATLFLETSPEDFAAVHRVNSLGVFHTLQAAAKAMVAAGAGGSLLTVASVNGIKASARRAAYGSAKASALFLTQICAVELARHGIRANVLCPGPVETPLVKAVHDEATRREWNQRIPMARYGTIQEMAGLAVFLASDAAGYITGQVIAVDGGWSIAGLMMER